MPRFPALPTIALACALPFAAQAIQVCDLDGQPVNPANGSTTAGKTGLMRCCDGDGGAFEREQELQRGVFMGVVRHFRGGVLEREHRVNERGNRDGRSREFAATPGGSNPVLRDETYRDGTTVGLARAWHPGGAVLRRIAFHGDDGREQAVAEFNREGRLAELRCAPTARLAPDADDAAWCGHAGPATVMLYAGNGTARARVTHDHGNRTGLETLWENGRVRDQQQADANGGVERSFSVEGVWRVGSRSDTRPLGVHQGFDAEGRLRSERFHDARGRIARERELDEAGRTTRDNEVFEDGSRKAYAK